MLRFTQNLTWSDADQEFIAAEGDVVPATLHYTLVDRLVAMGYAAEPTAETQED